MKSKSKSSSKDKKPLKAYMGFNRVCGPEEGACLIIAHHCREAKKLAYHILSSWGLDEGWPEMAVRMIRKPNKQAQDLIEAGKPGAVECPELCKGCETWGHELDGDGYCEQCVIDNE